jgi:flagellar protein FlbD
VIRLTRLNNQVFVVNSDLVKYVENAPDTVLTLITGEKFLVRESADEIIDRIVEFRRRLYSGLPAGGVDPGTGSAALARRQGPEGSSSESEDCG